MGGADMKVDQSDVSQVSASLPETHVVNDFQVS